MLYSYNEIRIEENIFSDVVNLFDKKISNIFSEKNLCISGPAHSSKLCCWRVNCNNITLILILLIVMFQAQDVPPGIRRL